MIRNGPFRSCTAEYSNTVAAAAVGPGPCPPSTGGVGGMSLIGTPTVRLSITGAVDRHDDGFGTVDARRYGGRRARISALEGILWTSG